MFSSRSRRVGNFRSGILLLALVALFKNYANDSNPTHVIQGADAFVARPNLIADIARARERKARSSLRLAIVEPLVSLVKATTDSYGEALIQNPLPTKSLTAGALCGISDVLAQKRSAKENFSDEYDAKRTIRFASKGCLGGIVWMFWYDWIDGFLTYSNAIDETISVDGTTLDASKLSFYALLASILPPDAYQACINHSGFTKTAVSMVLEQLLWCPLVYGTFEIPVSTLLNGGRPSTIPQEVSSKLNGLLWNNLYVWTPANIVIYNAPLEWRLFLGNIIDLFWQSIVSDVAADCGKDEECALTDDEDDGIFDVEKTMIAMTTANTESDISSVEKTIAPDQSSVYADESRM